MMGAVIVTKDHPLSRANTQNPFRINGRKFLSVDEYVSYQRGEHESPNWRVECAKYVHKAYAAKYNQNKKFREAIKATKDRAIREDQEDDLPEACPGDKKRWLVSSLLESYRRLPPK